VTLIEPCRIEILPLALRQMIQVVVERLKPLFGAQPWSWTLTGPAAVGVPLRGRHKLHSVLLLAQVDFERLHELARDMPQLTRHGFAPPLTFTPDFLELSLDTFPLELLEIQQQHLTVWGDDRFTGLKFDARHIRHQCERELSTMSLAIRQALLASAGSRRKFLRHRLHAADGVTRVLRGMLWLKGHPEARPPAQVVTEVQSVVGRALPGMQAMIQGAREADWNDYRQLHADLEALGRIVDGW